MKAWPILSVGVIAAALCCLLTPIGLGLLGVASFRAIAGDLFLPVLVGIAALAALTFGLRALARHRRSNDRSYKKA